MKCSICGKGGKDHVILIVPMDKVAYHLECLADRVKAPNGDQFLVIGKIGLWLEQLGHHVNWGSVLEKPEMDIGEVLKVENVPRPPKRLKK